MAELTYQQKISIIEAALQEGAAALVEAIAELERKDNLISEMTEMVIGYMHLIRSDYEGRNGLMGQMEDEYKNIVALLGKARAMGVPNA